MNILVLCSPDTAEAQRELSGHNLFLVLDLSQSTHGLQPTAVLLLDFMYDQDLNTALRHLPDVIAFAEQVRRDHGPIDRVISFNEATHYLAAEIRERFGIRGDDRRAAARYRDKWVMYQRFRDAGLPAPRTRLLPPGTTEITGMADMIVIKPREQAASRGVQLMPRRDWRGGHTRTDLLVQDRVDGDYYHFDAAFRNGVLVYCAVNRYLYHGLDWASGQAPMASVTEQRPERHTRAVNLVNQLGKAFEVGNQVLHIEAFWVPTQDDFTFIELANRPGGALIVAANIVAGNLNLEAESIRDTITAVTGVIDLPSSDRMRLSSKSV